MKAANALIGALNLLALLLIGAGAFCLLVKLPHYSFACGVLSIAAILFTHELHE